MKHLFKSLITLATIALFASCAREPGDPRGVASGDRLPATFELKMDGVATKAFSDGNSANALLVGVYNKQGEGETAKYTYLDELSKETVADAITVSGKAATFETNLVRGQNYVVVFWAQKSDCTAYDVDFAAEKLTVTTTGNANDESRDAFYKVFETGPITETNYNFVGIELTRPFAQINVLAPNEDVVAAAKSKVLFSKSALTVKKAPNTMDLLTGAVSGSADYTYSAAAITEPAFGDYANTHTYIAMDYILAGDTKGVYDVALDVYSTVGEVDQSPIHFDVTSAPAQRNYRTNIIGNVFTIDASFNIIINPIYNTPDYSEGLGLTFEPTTITPTVPTTLPEGVSITPAGGTTPSVINFGVAALNASTPVTIPVTPSVNTTVKARSSNVAVATAEVVEGPGVKVTPVAPGEAVITIYTDAILATKSADVDSTKNYAGAKYEYKVVVEKPVVKKDVTIVSQDINLKLNESATLEYEVEPEDAKVVITPAEGADEYFTWDATTKKVTAKKVTPAGGVGIALTVAETDTTKAASETVYVIISEKAVPTVVFDVFTLKVDETKEIEYQVEPKDLAVTFEVEKDQEVMGLVKVEGKDAVKGLKGGSAKLTLKIAETATTAAFSKTVTINVDKLEATVTADALSLTAGETKTLVADEDFLTDSDGVVSLSVANKYADYLTVEPGTLKVKALKEGAAKLSINVAESDKYLAATEEVDVTIAAAPVATPTEATITIEGVPTEAVEPGASFDVTITTNSSAALVVSATAGASVAPKSGNVYTVTAADDLTADTEVTLTASVAAVENVFTAAEKTAKFTVKKKEETETLDFTNNVEFEVNGDTKSYAEKALINGATDEVDILKLATGSAAGSATIYVPSGSTKLTFFALAWNGRSSTLTFTQDGAEIGTAQPESNAGVANSSPYTVTGVTSANQYTISLTSDNPITVSAAKDNRAILFGVKGNGTGAINKPAVQTQLAFASENVELQLGSEKTVTATVTPSTAVVKYSSSAPTVVTVDESTGKISCGSAAAVNSTATITATVDAVAGQYTAATASYSVKVVAAPNPNEDNMKATETVTLSYEESFLASVGKFKVYDEKGIDGQDIWTQSTQYGMVAKAFISNARYETVSWLYSPNINLGTATKPTLTFSHAGRYLGSLTDVSLWVREADGEWAQVAFSGDVTNTSFNYVDNTIDLTSYAGKTIQVAFKYTSTTEAAGTYEVKNFKVEDTNAPKFSVDKNEFSVGASATNVTVNITANVAWTVTAGAGVTADKTSGSENAAVKLSFAANTITTAQTYTATIAATGFDPVTVTINQAAYVEPSGDETIISVDFSTNPGSLPEGSTNKTVTETTYAFGGYDFKIAGSTGNGYYWQSDGYLLFGKQGAYIALPVVNGKKLVEVAFKTGANASENVILDIHKADGTDLNINAEKIKKATEYNWTINGETDIQYLIYVENAYNAQFVNLTLTYN